MLKLLQEKEVEALACAYRERFTEAPFLEAGLRDMLRQSLATPGSLLRGQLAFKILNEYGIDRELSLDVSAALEYFHLASLVLDDLPCMDNAEERRGCASAHREFGEATAILGSLALINRAYALVFSSISHLPRARHREAVGLIEDCLGVKGILGGQAHDLAFMQSAANDKQIADIAVGKTSSLFRLSFLLPAIIADVSPSQLHRLSRFARLLGLSYQLLDDFKDLQDSPDRFGKTPRDQALARPNMVLHLGSRKAARRLSRLLLLAKESAVILENKESKWRFLRDITDFLEQQAKLLRTAAADSDAAAA